MYSLEDSVEKIQRSISDKTINTVFQEDLIKDLVNTAISETLKDLKQQHKNSTDLKLVSDSYSRFRIRIRSFVFGNRIRNWKV